MDGRWLPVEMVPFQVTCWVSGRIFARIWPSESSEGKKCGGGKGSIKLLMVKRKSWRAPRNIQGLWSLIRRKWCGISSTTSSRYLVVSSLYPQHVQKGAEIPSCQLRFFQPSNTLQITPVPYVVLKCLGFASTYPCCIHIFWIHPPNPGWRWKVKVYRDSLLKM